MINNNINFQPYKGDEYNYQDLNLLVLGESHYGEDKEDKTNDVIKRYIENNDNYRFFHKVLGTVFGDYEEKKEKFNTIAFYNYIQEIVAENARTRPSPEMWERAAGPFMEVLANLKPDIIICLGKSLYNHLPYNEERSHGKKHIINYIEVYEYHYKVEKDITLYAVNHPASFGYKAVNTHMALCEIDERIKRLSNKFD